MVTITVKTLNAKRQSMWGHDREGFEMPPGQSTEIPTLFATVHQLQSGFPTADSPGRFFTCTSLKPGFVPTSPTGCDWYWPVQSPGPVTHCWDGPSFLLHKPP